MCGKGIKFLNFKNCTDRIENPDFADYVLYKLKKLLSSVDKLTLEPIERWKSTDPCKDNKRIM